MLVCAQCIWNLLLIQLLFQSNIYTYNAACFYWLKFKRGNTEFEDIILAIFTNTKIYVDMHEIFSFLRYFKFMSECPLEAKASPSLTSSSHSSSSSQLSAMFSLPFVWQLS
jgi:hypothetical protein